MTHLMRTEVLREWSEKQTSSINPDKQSSFAEPDVCARTRRMRYWRRDVIFVFCVSILLENYHFVFEFLNVHSTECGGT